jgi:hypothetical protein
MKTLVGRVFGSGRECGMSRILSADCSAATLGLSLVFENANLYGLITDYDCTAKEMDQYK